MVDWSLDILVAAKLGTIDQLKEIVRLGRRIYPRRWWVERSEASGDKSSFPTWNLINVRGPLESAYAWSTERMIRLPLSCLHQLAGVWTFPGTDILIQLVPNRRGSMFVADDRTAEW